MWEYGTYTKEQYFEKRKSEKLLSKYEIEVIPEEIIIPKLTLADGEKIKWVRKKGSILSKENIRMERTFQEAGIKISQISKISIIQ
jgi:hypothetical protein